MFPDEPNIKLPNYLHKLDEDIMLIGANKPLLKAFKETGNSYKKAAKEFGVHNTTIRCYLIGKTPYRIKFLKAFSRRYHSHVLDSVFDAVQHYTTKTEKVKLPKYLTPKLAYYVGYLQGDGWLGKNKKRFGFIDEYSEQMKLINALTQDLFETSGKIMEDKSKISTKPYNYLIIRRKAVNSFLHSVFEINLGIKNNLEIPKLIKQNKELLRWHLRGLFDADGTLPKNPEKAKMLFIDIALKDKSFIEEIKKKLSEEFGIETLKIYARKSKSPSSGKENITWELRIRSHKIIKRFLEEIGFIHPNKSERTKKLLSLLINKKRTRSSVGRVPHS